jgi:hypothetical protein
MVGAMTFLPLMNLGLRAMTVLPLPPSFLLSLFSFFSVEPRKAEPLFSTFLLNCYASISDNNHNTNNTTPLTIVDGI